MTEDDYADTHPEFLFTHVDGGQAEGLACADPVARTPIGMSGNFLTFNHKEGFFYSQKKKK